MIDLESLAPEALEGWQTEGVSEVVDILAQVRDALNSASADDPIAVTNRDWWALVITLGAIMSKIGLFNSVHSELAEKLRTRIDRLEGAGGSWLGGSS